MSIAFSTTEDQAELHRSSSSEDSNSDIDLKDEHGWEDAEPEKEETRFISLLDDEVFTDINCMLNHCKEKHGFDFLHNRQILGLDFYGTIKLVNFIRSRVKDGHNVPSHISNEDFKEEKFLKPVLEDDAVLFSLDDLPDPLEELMNQDKGGKGLRNVPGELVARISELEEELRRTRMQFDNYRTIVSQALEDRWNDKSTDEPSERTKTKEEKRDDDSHYFNSYSYNDIHETMLKDTVRTDAYRDFIYEHKLIFQGKTVLDVGCGTGILSMFCVKAGAARVIAVDNSAIIDKARENIFNNGFSDKITCLRGKIEEVSLPIDKVDIIVSEWMGYCLLYEAMLDSVIWARDKYLRADGLIVPSHMNMWIAPAADPDFIADHISFWRDVYGFDMKAMQAGIHEDVQVLDMPTMRICGDPFPFLHLSLHTTTTKDLTFKKKWYTKLSKDIDTLDGFIVWFDSFFITSRDENVPENAKAEEWVRDGRNGTAFTTGPNGKLTHWKQGVLLTESIKEQPVPRKSGDEIRAEIEYAVPEDNSRALTIGMKWKFGEEAEKFQTWKMR